MGDLVDHLVRQDLHVFPELLGHFGPGAVRVRVVAFVGDDVFADDLHRIACPALFLTGADDPNSTAEMARTMALEAPMGQAVVIPNHRHMVNLTAPDIVNAALTDWLGLPLAQLEKRA